MVWHHFYPGWHVLSKETKQEMCCATTLLPSVMTEVCRKGACTGCACPRELIQTWESLCCINLGTAALELSMKGICWSTLLLLRRGRGGFSSLYLFVLLKGKQNNYLYTETWWLSISMSCWSCHPKAWWQPVCRSSLCSKYPNLWVQLSPLGNVPRKAFPCTFPRASAFKFATFLLHLAVLFAWTGLVARSSGLTGPSCQSVCSSDEVVGKCSLSSSRFGSGTLIRLGLSYLTPGAVPPP